MGNFFVLRAVTANWFTESAMSIPDQIVVKLQYSNKLGDVTQSNLQALLDDLSKVRALDIYSYIPCTHTWWLFSYLQFPVRRLQWTLSAPIQAGLSSGPVSSCGFLQSSVDDNSLTPAAVAVTNQFCMTNPCSGSGPKAKWPYGVTECTDTILVDYWFAANDIQPIFTTLDDFVKTKIANWIKDEQQLNFKGPIW